MSEPIRTTFDLTISPWEKYQTVQLQLDVETHVKIDSDKAPNKFNTLETLETYVLYLCKTQLILSSNS